MQWIGVDVSKIAKPDTILKLAQKTFVNQDEGELKEKGEVKSTLKFEFKYDFDLSIIQKVFDCFSNAKIKGSGFCYYDKFSEFYSENKKVLYKTYDRVKSFLMLLNYDELGNEYVNKREIENFFGLETLRVIVNQPLVLTGTKDKFDVLVNVHGGGFTGQAGAIRHGIARALNEANSEYRPALKSNGFLTRDPRMKERKKYGLKKARKAPQFSKR